MLAKLLSGFLFWPLSSLLLCCGAQAAWSACQVKALIKASIAPMEPGLQTEVHHHGNCRSNSSSSATTWSGCPLGHRSSASATHGKLPAIMSDSYPHQLRPPPSRSFDSASDSNGSPCCLLFGSPGLISQSLPLSSPAVTPCDWQPGLKTSGY